MKQQKLIYSFVARGTVILAEHTEFAGEFTGVASQCLHKLPPTNNKFNYDFDGYTFDYLAVDGFTYCIVTIDSVGRQVPIAFLEMVKDEFSKRYGGEKAATAMASSLSQEFGPKLKQLMHYCMDHPEEISKLAKVKDQLSEVKIAMIATIEAILDRDAKIDLIGAKPKELQLQAEHFRKVSAKMRRKMWFQKMKIMLIVLGIIIALIFIIVLSVCHGFNC